MLETESIITSVILFAFKPKFARAFIFEIAYEEEALLELLIDEGGFFNSQYSRSSKNINILSCLKLELDFWFSFVLEVYELCRHFY